eukprot:6414125-Amphidinium_carterae.2
MFAQELAGPSRTAMLPMLVVCSRTCRTNVAPCNVCCCLQHVGLSNHSVVMQLGDYWLQLGPFRSRLEQASGQ